MAARQLSDKSPDGTSLGQSTTDKISFFGVTTVVQQTGFAAATVAKTTTTTATTTALQTDVDALRVAMLLVRTALVNLGAITAA